MSRVCNERMEVEKTAHILGEDYVRLILSDMKEEEIYCNYPWMESEPVDIPRTDSIELDWDGIHNVNDEIK